MMRIPFGKASGKRRGLPASPLIQGTRPPGSRVRALRRASQTAFLLLFLVLLIQTDYAGTNQIPYPVKLFLDLDPLALLAILLPSRGLSPGLPLAIFGSVLLLVLTVVGGRFFCGWICPLGSLHHLCSLRRGAPVRSLREGRPERRAEASPPREARAANPTTGQSLKVYLLVGLLVAALFSFQWLGVMDPLSLLIRSLAVGLLPALNYALHALFYFLYEATGGALQQASEFLYDGLKAHFLSFRQPYFQQGLFLSLILLTLFYLNRVRPRFWCRLLCPLGALLSLFSRFSLWQLQADERCNGCGQCLKECQGGARPYPAPEWRRGECLLCLNCQGRCPRQALHFGLTWPWGQPARGVDLQRRYLLASALAGLSLPALARPNLATRHPQPGLIRPPGRLARRGVLEPLHPLRGVFKGLPDQWPPADPLGGRAGRDLDPPADPQGGILRVRLHPLRSGLSHRGHPGAEGGGEGQGGDRAGLHRPGPLPSPRLWHRMHRLRGALPHPQEGDLLRAEVRLLGPRGSPPAHQAAPRGPQALHRLRDLRAQVPGG